MTCTSSWFISIVMRSFAAMVSNAKFSGATWMAMTLRGTAPAAALLLGKIPSPDEVGTVTLFGVGPEITFYHKTLLKVLAFAIFYVSLIPLIFGGKIYNALRAVMTFKIVVVMACMRSCEALISTLPGETRGCGMTAIIDSER